MYDWRGKFIEQDDPELPPRPRDRMGHFLPWRPAGVRVYQLLDQTYFDEEWQCTRTIAVPVYQEITMSEPLPEDWQWDQEYYACKRCGHVFAEE